MIVALPATHAHDVRADELLTFWRSLDEPQRNAGILAGALFAHGFDTCEIARLIGGHEPAISKLIDAFREARRA